MTTTKDITIDNLEKLSFSAPVDRTGTPHRVEFSIGLNRDLFDIFAIIVGQYAGPASGFGNLSREEIFGMIQRDHRVLLEEFTDSQDRISYCASFDSREDYLCFRLKWIKRW